MKHQKMIERQGLQRVKRGPRILISQRKQNLRPEKPPTMDPGGWRTQTGKKPRWEQKTAWPWNKSRKPGEKRLDNANAKFTGGTGERLKRTESGYLKKKT